MRRFIHTAAIAAAVLYPFLVFLGLRHWGLSVLAPLLLFLFLLRFFQSPLSRRAFSDTANRWFACVGIALVLLSWLMKQSSWLLYYPVFMSFALLSVFAFSLLKGPSVIERIARLSDPDLPPEAVVYTRKVTFVWVCFFFLNALVSLATILSGSMRAWTLYNGALSYGFMGCLLAGEYLLRRRIRRNLKGHMA